MATDPTHIQQLNESLGGSIYTFDLDGDPARTRTVSEELRQLARRLDNYRERAGRVASGARRRLEVLQRTRLLVESSAIEGIELDFAATLEAIERVEQGPRDGIAIALQKDDKVSAAMGLARAHRLGMDLASGSDRPLLEYELRQIHRQICEGAEYAGRLRRGDIEIGGADHQPPAEADMREQLPNLLAWFSTRATADPIVVAATTHTWLAHLHPFEDGNGRLARLLANMALSRASFPPVIVRSGAARLEYYDVLAQSDVGGEIVPVVAFFLQEARRSLAQWESPDDSILALEAEMIKDLGHDAWRGLALRFVDELAQVLEPDGFEVEHLGLPDRTDFSLLQKRIKGGNGWLATIKSRGTRTARPVDLLLWYGYSSSEYLADPRARLPWPSLYFSERDRRPEAVHPFRPLHDGDDLPVQEVVLRARLTAEPCAVRSEGEIGIMDVDNGVACVRRAILAIGDDPRRESLHRGELTKLVRGIR